MLVLAIEPGLQDGVHHGLVGQAAVHLLVGQAAKLTQLLECSSRVRRSRPALLGLEQDIQKADIAIRPRAMGNHRSIDGTLVQRGNP